MAGATVVWVCSALVLALLVGPWLTQRETSNQHNNNNNNSKDNVKGKTKVVVEWIAPFGSKGGYSSEALSSFQALQSAVSDKEDWAVLAIDSSLEQQGLEEKVQTRKQADDLLSSFRPKFVVRILHDRPDRWPQSTTIDSQDLNGNKKKKAEPQWKTITVGRTMYETDRVPFSWLPSLLSVDHLWLPSSWNLRIFQKDLSSPHANRLRFHNDIDPSVPFLHFVPEALDFGLFDPERKDLERIKALELPSGFEKQILSVFKWERRKGWDILISSFCHELFLQQPHTRLVIVSWPHHPETMIEEEINKWIKNEIRDPKEREMLEQCVSSSSIRIVDPFPPHSMPSVFHHFPVFVLASHGEGWGRPYMEALSMNLITIGTNATGNLEFMDNQNSLLIEVEDELEKIAGDWSEEMNGHKWFSPKVSSLRKLLRQAVSSSSSSLQFGQSPRLSIFHRFSLEKVGQLMVEKIESIIEDQL